MTNRILGKLADILFPQFSTLRNDDETATPHEALHGDSAVIRLVRELRELESTLADDTAVCR